MNYARAITLRVLRFLAVFRPVQAIATWLIRMLRPPSGNSVASESLILVKSEIELLQHLRTNGFALGLNLGADACVEVMRYAREHVFIANGSGNAVRPDQFHGEPKSHIFRRINPHLDCLVVRSLTNDTRLVTLAANYLGATPILLNTQIWFSLPPPNPGKEDLNPEYGFHYDIDDFKFIKLFFYLTDVDMRAGPHVAIPGTHKDHSMVKKLRRRLPPTGVAVYGEPFVFLGPAGTGFVEDTSIYHKASVPLASRAVLQLEFALTPLLKMFERPHGA